MNRAQMPDLGCLTMGWASPFQLLKSPTTETRSAWGAHTANLTPASPFSSTRCAPSMA